MAESFRKWVRPEDKDTGAGLEGAVQNLVPAPDGTDRARPVLHEDIDSSDTEIL
jgi:hypothetical protein